jgi:hypothetical protein
VCDSLPAHAFAIAVPQGPGPPLHVERSSSGHFPPPRRALNELIRMLKIRNKKHATRPLRARQGVEVPAPSRHLLYMKWGPPTPPSPPKGPKGPKTVKNSKIYIFL